MKVEKQRGEQRPMADHSGGLSAAGTAEESVYICVFVCERVCVCV